MTYFDNVAAGLVVLGVLVATSNTAMMFTLDKSSGLLRRLDSNPVSRSIQLLSGASAQFVFSSIQVTILLGSLLIFGVQYHPDVNWFLAYLSAIVLSFTCIGLGMIIASFADKPDAPGGLAWIVILPLQFLGEVFWSMNNNISKFIPSYYSVNSIRKIVLLGAKWNAVGNDILINLAFGAVFSLIGLFLFSKRNQI